ncbi:hypothetical protein ABIA16_003552 [Sinorhizobium fredii]
MKPITGYDLIAAGWSPGPGYNDAIDRANYLLRNGHKRSCAIETGIEHGMAARALYVPKRMRTPMYEEIGGAPYVPPMIGTWMPWSTDQILSTPVVRPSEYSGGRLKNLFDEPEWMIVSMRSAMGIEATT